MSEWKPISTAPSEDGVHVLVSDGASISTAYRDYGSWCIGQHSWPVGFKPTHWMELPAPPPSIPCDGRKHAIA
jgi:hypothetical protein